MTDVLNGFAPQCGKSGYSSFRAERISSSLVLISVRGELDLANAPSLHAYVRDQTVTGRKLVLDLSEVDFIGTDGLSVLLAMERRVEQLDVGWALVSGRIVNRLLDVAGIEGRFPVYDSLPEAFASLRAPQL